MSDEKPAEAQPAEPVDPKVNFANKFLLLCVEAKRPKSAYVQFGAGGEMLIGGHKEAARILAEALRVYFKLAAQGRAQRPPIIVPRRPSVQGTENPTIPPYLAPGSVPESPKV